MMQMSPFWAKVFFFKKLNVIVFCFTSTILKPRVQYSQYCILNNQIADVLYVSNKQKYEITGYRNIDLKI